jgi:hypothetical protein
MIQFYILNRNNSSKYRSICECISSENAGSKLLDAYRQREISQFCFVTSENWKAEIHPIGPAALFL